MLAASELVNQWFRLFPGPAAGSGGGGGGSRDKGAPGGGVVGMAEAYWYERRLVTMAVALPAALFAGEEVLHDLRPGAHHAVAILAAAQFLENAYRAISVGALGGRPAPKAMIV